MKRLKTTGLSDEVLAVLESSPNLVPCTEFHEVDIVVFANHLKEGKCHQCIQFFRQAEAELKTMKLLRECKNAAIH